MKVELIHNGFSQHLLIENKPSYLRIASRPSDGVNSILITLDASTTSLLQWKEAISQAKEWKEKGFWILWELDFSLHLNPFFDTTTLLTLENAVEEFMRTIWPAFQDVSLGVVFFRGEMGECRKFMEDLKLLASRAADEMSCFLLLDTTLIESEADFFHQTRQDFFAHFIPILKGPLAEKYPLASPSLGWDHGRSSFGLFSEECFENRGVSSRQASAIHLPDLFSLEALQEIVALNLFENFRVIPDALLTQEWQGIDDLFVFSKEISDRTKRKLLGFCAAGGRVISTQPIGLANEISLADFLAVKKS